MIRSTTTDGSATASARPLRSQPMSQAQAQPQLPGTPERPAVRPALPQPWTRPRDSLLSAYRPVQGPARHHPRPDSLFHRALDLAIGHGDAALVDSAIGVAQRRGDLPRQALRDVVLSGILARTDAGGPAALQGAARRLQLDTPTLLNDAMNRGDELLAQGAIYLGSARLTPAQVGRLADTLPGAARTALLCDPDLARVFDADAFCDIMLTPLVDNAVHPASLPDAERDAGIEQLMSAFPERVWDIADRMPRNERLLRAALVHGEGPAPAAFWNAVVNGSRPLFRTLLQERPALVHPEMLGYLVRTGRFDLLDMACDLNLGAVERFDANGCRPIDYASGRFGAGLCRTVLLNHGSPDLDIERAQNALDVAEY